MKYTILGFQQEKLIENGFKTDDALILRVIKDMYSSASMEFKDFDGTKYMWVNYSYFLKQIPIIGSKSNLMAKIKKYSEKYLLLRKLEYYKNEVKGSYAYISPTKELDKLQDYDYIQDLDRRYTNTGHPLSKENIPPIQNLDNKDTSIKDTSIKDNIHVKEIENDIDEIRNKYLGTKKKANADLKIPPLLKKYSKEELIRGIERYNEYVKAERKTGFNLRYQTESTYWNGGYMDYLDENFLTETTTATEHKPLTMKIVNL